MWTEKIDDEASALVISALAEDRVSEDVTSITAFTNNEHCSLKLTAREPAVISGMPVLNMVYENIDADITVDTFFDDGDRVGEGDIIAIIHGAAVSVLSGERTVLNFIQRLSGIATLTSKYVEKISGTDAQIVDTRKTTPGWRLLEKYAVKCGGGVNHRFHLADMMMFKDNHIALSGKSISQLIKSARELYPDLQIACEADTIEQVEILTKSNVDIIMLDNMSIEMTRKAVELGGRGVVFESTGGITLDNVRDFAETGVARISIGALTHSARAVDLGMDVESI